LPQQMLVPLSATNRLGKQESARKPILLFSNRFVSKLQLLA